MQHCDSCDERKKRMTDGFSCCLERVWPKEKLANFSRIEVAKVILNSKRDTQKYREDFATSSTAVF